MNRKCLLFVLVLILYYCFPAWAFDDKRTHRELTAAAINPTVSNLENYLINNLGLSEGYDKQLNGVDRKGYEQNYSIFKWLQEGSEDEDALNFCRAANHFHNPIHSGDWLSSQMSDSGWVDAVCGSTRYSNVTWATGYTAPITSFIASRTGQDMGWDNARTYLYQSLTSQNSATREELLVKTFKSVGMVMHLLQDMAVPAHTRNDMTSHIINSYNPLKWGSNPFEKYVINHSVAMGNTPIKPTFTAPFRHTDFWDKDTYSGVNPSNSTDQGLAEYSNANFFSDSTIPTNGPSTEHQFPNPQITSASYICTDTLPGSKKPTKYVSRTPCPTSGGTVDHLAAVSLVNTESDSSSASTIKKAWLDNNVHDTYANDLLPRTVGYSAALLDHFFRGKIDITVPTNGLYSMIPGTATEFTSVKLRAKNGSIAGEEMTDGSIELVVKYKVAQEDPFKSGPVPTTPDFSYIVVPEKNNIRLISRAYTDFNFDLSQTPIPLTATDVYLQLVYKGKLGNENGAVTVGFKDISEPTPIDMFNSMDKICMNGSWNDAGSPEAIAQVDSNHDGIAEADVYAYGMENIYLRFSPYSTTAPLYYASATAYDFKIPSLVKGDNVRAVYILGDYTFIKSHYLSQVKLDPTDPYTRPNMSSINGQYAVKRQKDYSTDSTSCGGYPPCYIDVYPEHRDAFPPYFSGFYTFRNTTMWWGSVKIIYNTAYPTNSLCSFDLL